MSEPEDFWVRVVFDINLKDLIHSQDEAIARQLIYERFFAELELRNKETMIDVLADKQLTPSSYNSLKSFYSRMGELFYQAKNSYKAFKIIKGSSSK